MCDRCSYCNDGTLLPRLWLTLRWKKRKATVESLACCFDPSCWNSCLEARHWFRDGECKSDIQTRNTVPDSSTQSQIPRYIFLKAFGFLTPIRRFHWSFSFCLFVWCVQMIEPCLIAELPSSTAQFWRSPWNPTESKLCCSAPLIRMNSESQLWWLTSLTLILPHQPYVSRIDQACCVCICSFLFV